MFSLAEALPTSINLDDVVYELDMSFDNVILIYDVLNDEKLSDTAQIYTIIQLLFGQELDMSIEKQSEVFKVIYENYIEFDKEDDIQYDRLGNPMPAQNSTGDNDEQLYDLKEDSSYIFASFMQDYKIDLFEQRGKMHWWKFKALLNGLSDGTKFRKVLEVRQMEVPNGKGTAKQREQVLKAKKAYKLKSKRGEIDG